MVISLSSPDRNRKSSLSATDPGTRNFRSRPLAVCVGDQKVDVELGPSSKKFVDLDVLEKLVDAETFKKIVNATQGKVTNHAGALVLAECLKTVVGDDDLSIKERK